MEKYKSIEKDLIEVQDILDVCISYIPFVYGVLKTKKSNTSIKKHFKNSGESFVKKMIIIERELTDNPLALIDLLKIIISRKMIQTIDGFFAVKSLQNIINIGAITTTDEIEDIIFKLTRDSNDESLKVKKMDVVSYVIRNLSEGLHKKEEVF